MYRRKFTNKLGSETLGIKIVRNVGNYFQICMDSYLIDLERHSQCDENSDLEK